MAMNMFTVAVQLFSGMARMALTISDPHSSSAILHVAHSFLVRESNKRAIIPDQTLAHDMRVFRGIRYGRAAIQDVQE